MRELIGISPRATLGVNEKEIKKGIYLSKMNEFIAQIQK